MASDGQSGQRRRRRARQHRGRELRARMTVDKLGLAGRDCIVLVLRLRSDAWPLELEPRQWKRLSDAIRRQHQHGLGDAFDPRRPDIGLLGSRGWREERHVVVAPEVAHAWRSELLSRRSYGFDPLDELTFGEGA